ncbi:hypothetical protein ACJ72_08266, partial [Emergomyces africanus]
MINIQKALKKLKSKNFKKHCKKLSRSYKNFKNMFDKQMTEELSLHCDPEIDHRIKLLKKDDKEL